MVVAKEPAAHAHLHAQFAARTTDRRYEALLCGVPDQEAVDRVQHAAQTHAHAAVAMPTLASQESAAFAPTADHLRWLDELEDDDGARGVGAGGGGGGGGAKATRGNKSSRSSFRKDRGQKRGAKAKLRGGGEEGGGGGTATAREHEAVEAVETGARPRPSARDLTPTPAHPAPAHPQLLAHGPPLASGRITGNIGRDPTNRLRMAVVGPGKGKHAATNYTVLKASARLGVSLVSFKLETGRTHQVKGGVVVVMRHCYRCYCSVRCSAAAPLLTPLNVHGRAPRSSPVHFPLTAVPPHRDPSPRCACRPPALGRRCLRWRGVGRDRRRQRSQAAPGGPCGRPGGDRAYRAAGASREGAELRAPGHGREAHVRGSSAGGLLQSDGWSELVAEEEQGGACRGRGANSTRNTPCDPPVPKQRYECNPRSRMHHLAAPSPAIHKIPEPSRVTLVSCARLSTRCEPPGFNASSSAPPPFPFPPPPRPPPPAPCNNLRAMHDPVRL